MPLYKITDKKLEPVSELPYKLERDLQNVTEANLELIFGLKFVRREFFINNLRIDTLAFDKDARSFTIIEYKRDKNFSVVDQGLTYLGLMLNNKADMILEYNEKCNASLKRDDVDWTQSKVIFISPQFTLFQRESINFKDLPIELWEVKKYSNNTIRFDKHEPANNNASLKTVSNKSETVNKIVKEVKVYTEEEHLNICIPEIKELYYKFKEMVLAIGDDITVKPMKQYIAFKSKSNITDVVPHKNKLSVYLNLHYGKLDDPKKLARNVTDIGHWGNGDYRLNLLSVDELEYVVSMVRQSYKLNRNKTML